MALGTINIFSKHLRRTVTFNVIIPADKMVFGHEQTQKKEKVKPYKTLYLLHGIFGNYTDWVSGTRIQAWAQDRNCAVVMPSGYNKFYVDNELSGEYYSKFIGEELVEITRKMFNLSHKREDTFIAGLSMGGYGALVNGLKYHKTFGYIAALSAAVHMEHFVNVKEDAENEILSRSELTSIFGDLDKLMGSDKDYKYFARNIKSKKPMIFMACGTEDHLLEYNRIFRDYLLNLNYDVTYFESTGGHDWIFWDTYILKVLEWLPLDKKVEAISSGNVREKNKTQYNFESC